MKSLMRAFLAPGLVLFTALSGSATPESLKLAKSTALSKTEILKSKDEAEKPAINGALMAILNQIVAAKVDINFKISSKGKKVDGVDKSVLAIKYLDFAFLAAFNDEILIKFVDDKTTNPQIAKVVPSVRFTTKGMQVIAKMNIDKGGTFSVRFCQSYSLQNDYCDTQDHTKILGVSLKSPSFGMLDIRIEEFKGQFDDTIADGKIGFKGTCTVFKDTFSPTSATVTHLKKVDDCSFGGTYDSSRPVPFEYDFNFVSKQ